MVDGRRPLGAVRVVLNNASAPSEAITAGVGDSGQTVLTSLFDVAGKRLEQRRGVREPKRPGITGTRQREGHVFNHHSCLPRAREQVWGNRELAVLVILVIYVCTLALTGTPFPLAATIMVVTVALARWSTAMPVRRA